MINKILKHIRWKEYKNGDVWKLKKNLEPRYGYRPGDSKYSCCFKR